MTDTRGAVRTGRLVLIAGGVLLVGVGAAVLLESVSPARYAGIALWFAGALVLHDAIIAPVAILIGRALARTGRRLPGAVVVTLQGAAVVGATMTAIVLPAIYKQSLGTRNATVLPLDYGTNLAFVLGALVLVTAVLVAVELTISRRRSATG